MTTSSEAPAAPVPLRHSGVAAWIEEMIGICKPDRVHWCDGTDSERQALTEQAVGQGILIPLNGHLLPRCYYHRSHASDVARVESCTYICSASEADAGPTNHWAEPTAMRTKLMEQARG